MSHSSMLKTRRKRQKGKKDLAGAARRAKKLANLDVKKVGASAPKGKAG